MIEGKIVQARAQAMKDIEPLIRVLNQTLLETYMAGFMKGLEACEESQDILERKLQDEEDALASNQEPLVKLKPNAILKRRLKQEEFSVRVWNNFCAYNIKTLEDILSWSEKDYLSKNGFGKVSLAQIKTFVESFGYSLKTK